MANADTHEGGCLCGAVRYRAGAAPTEVSHCHCEMCRRHGGAPFETWASFPTGSFAFVKGEPKIYASSDIAERGFCGRCGSPLTFQYVGNRSSIGVTLGSLDRPDAVAPSVHYWADRMIPWLQMDDGLPRRAHDEE